MQQILKLRKLSKHCIELLAFLFSILKLGMFALVSTIRVKSLKQGGGAADDGFAEVTFLRSDLIEFSSCV